MLPPASARSWCRSRAPGAPRQKPDGWRSPAGRGRLVLGTSFSSVFFLFLPIVLLHPAHIHRRNSNSNSGSPPKINLRPLIFTPSRTPGSISPFASPRLHFSDASVLSSSCPLALVCVLSGRLGVPCVCCRRRRPPGPGSEQPLLSMHF